jgi:hypothetical protein
MLEVGSISKVVTILGVPSLSHNVAAKRNIIVGLISRIMNVLVENNGA